MHMISLWMNLCTSFLIFPSAAVPTVYAPLAIVVHHSAFVTWTGNRLWQWSKKTVNLGEVASNQLYRFNRYESLARLSSILCPLRQKVNFFKSLMPSCFKKWTVAKNSTHSSTYTCSWSLNNRLHPIQVICTPSWLNKFVRDGSVCSLPLHLESNSNIILVVY